MAIRMTVALSEDTWRGLRRLAEDERGDSGRASVSAIVRKLVEREVGVSRISSQTSEPAKA